MLQQRALAESLAAHDRIVALGDPVLGDTDNHQYDALGGTRPSCTSKSEARQEPHPLWLVSGHLALHGSVSGGRERSGLPACSKPCAFGERELVPCPHPSQFEKKALHGVRERLCQIPCLWHAWPTALDEVEQLGVAAPIFSDPEPITLTEIRDHIRLLQHVRIQQCPCPAL